MNILKTVTQQQPVQSAQRRYPSRHRKCSVLKTHKELRIQSKRECESSCRASGHLLLGSMHRLTQTERDTHIRIISCIHIYYIYDIYMDICMYTLPQAPCGRSHTLYVNVHIAYVFPGWRKLDSVHIQNGDACQEMPFHLNTQVFESIIHI
jgi:hypothetical protein